MSSELSKSSSIIIVGAGVFGLSTALHLSRRGYTNITVFDRQEYDITKYSYDLGCDAASADINKIIRCAYGSDTIYQNLSLEALEKWQEWNVLLSTSSNLPSGLKPTDSLYINSGSLNISTSTALPPFEQESLKNLTAAGKGHTQFVVTKESDIARAEELGFGYALDPFRRKEKGEPYNGILDTIGGLANADKACLFALHLARLSGVNFIFGPLAGSFSSFLYKPSGEVGGIYTEDGKEHLGARMIMACGGWTPSLIPELDGLCETTAGSVAFYEIPRDDLELWERFGPEKFPSFAVGIRDGEKGGIYGFPRDEQGFLKIGYRGTKYTNPILQPDGKERSVPITRWTSPSNINSLPSQALSVIQTFVSSYLPELIERKIPLVKSRLCWYSDSFDNHLIIDYVPSHHNLFVATGGSGHAFKYLPVLGKRIVDILERKVLVGDEEEVARRWKWRGLKEGEKEYNVLMEGSSGKRVLSKQVLVKNDDFMKAQIL